MARIDLKNKAIQAKLVYYGPGLCGKTTNLQYVNTHMAGGQELMSLATEGDRTIFFDFMPLGLGKLRGLDVQFKLYTVPGQVRYNQTRKMVLKNVDGVVFVADSQTEMIDANLESFDNLFENLRELGIDPDDVPIVLQYNKRDLPNVMSSTELDTALNKKRYSTFMASAFTGDGVVDTLKAACKEVLGHLSKALPGREEPADTPDATTSASPSPEAAGANAVEKPAADATTEPAKAQAAPGQDAIAELSRSLSAARQELAELRAPAELGEDTYDKLADRLVSKADMVVLHRRLDGVEEIAQNTGDLIAGLLERLGTVAGQLEGLGKTLAKRPEPAPPAKAELPPQLQQLPTKADLTSLAKKLDPLGQLPTKQDLAELGKKLDRLESAGGSGASSKPDSPQRKDLDELRTAVMKLTASVEAGKAAPAPPQPLAELKELAARLERVPTKAELAAVTKRLDALPTRADLERLEKSLTQALAQVRALAADQGAEARATSGGAEAPAAVDEAPASLPTEPGQAPAGTAAETEAQEEAGTTEAEAAPAAGASESPEAEQSAGAEQEAEDATSEAPASSSDEAAEANEPPAADAADVDDDSPEHKNAARVARVMVADLYLYNKDQVEAGIREGDFFERNHEALEDMRLTYESRVSEEVRAQKDHLRLAIETFIEKKRAKLAPP